jgi:hypothetical protein
MPIKIPHRTAATIIPEKEPPVFSEAIVEKIIHATLQTPKGRVRNRLKFPDAVNLAKALNQAYSAYYGWQQRSLMPTTEQFATAIENARNATRNTLSHYSELIDLTWQLEDFHPETKLLWHVTDGLENILQEMEILEGNLELLSRKRLISRGARERKAQVDFEGRILANVFFQHFGKEASITRTSKEGKPGGAYLDFVRACYFHLKIVRTDEAIASSFIGIKRKKK